MANSCPLKKNLAFFCFILSLVNLSSFNYKDLPWQAIVYRLEAHNENFPEEKIHIQTDNHYYAIGEEIWFKAYVG
ncbi:hypothetical protein [Pedobacter agri]|uniref:hypothetical protein n=1 Tax=Pedobacter agri TaxID=454586 RepID=UPI00292FF368|nr:hypothetical protein [Pedobacter agri]